MAAGGAAGEMTLPPRVGSANPLVRTVGALVATISMIAGPQSMMAAQPASTADRDCSAFDNQKAGPGPFIDRGADPKFAGVGASP
jgi:hypothetical protein